ncbi:hypothetical protein H0H93_012596, partial [Arthromyces matolae]
MPPSNLISQLEKKLNDLIDNSPSGRGPDSDASYDREKERKKQIAEVLADICDVVRNATGPSDPSFFSKVDELLNKGIRNTHENTDERPYMESFAHSEASPVLLVASKDNVESMMGQETLRLLLQIFSTPGKYQNLSKAKEFLPSPPWPESPHPHMLSTRLSRFKPDTNITPVPSNTLATYIYQARCEISSEVICAPIRAKISSGGSCLAITSAGGYKQREAVLTYRVLDDATSTTSTSNTSAPKLRWINPKFGDRAYHISIHESQKLLFAADPNRIKSFSWGKLNGENYQEALPVHTMNSKSFDGPISVLSNDRLIRAGKGSVA